MKIEVTLTLNNEKTSIGDTQFDVECDDLNGLLNEIKKVEKAFKKSYGRYTWVSAKDLEAFGFMFDYGDGRFLNFSNEPKNTSIDIVDDKNVDEVIKKFLKKAQRSQDNEDAQSFLLSLANGVRDVYDKDARNSEEMVNNAFQDGLNIGVCSDGNNIIRSRHLLLGVVRDLFFVGDPADIAFFLKSELSDFTLS